MTNWWRHVSSCEKLVGTSSLDRHLTTTGDVIAAPFVRNRNCWYYNQLLAYEAAESREEIVEEGLSPRHAGVEEDREVSQLVRQLLTDHSHRRAHPRRRTRHKRRACKPKFHDYLDGTSISMK